MNKRDEFLKSQKVLRLATIDKNKTHILLLFGILYSGKKIYIGTNTKTQKAKNAKTNKRVAFCVDVGINAPNIYGVMGQGDANLILENNKVKTIAKKILLRYFKTLEEQICKRIT